MRIPLVRPPKNGWCYCPNDVDDMPLEELFSYDEIREKREEMRKILRIHMDKMYKTRYGDEF